MMPFVQLQVIAYCSDEAPSDLSKLIESLEHILYPRDRWELVIIDNPSEQGTMREVDYDACHSEVPSNIAVRASDLFRDK